LFRGGGVSEDDEGARRVDRGGDVLVSSGALMICEQRNEVAKMEGRGKRKEGRKSCALVSSSLLSKEGQPRRDKTSLERS
jgi:hypothetical protein